MKIKEGDKVEIITGKDIGKTGEVIQVLPQDNMVVVEDLNMMVKHLKSRGGQQGQKVEFNAPLDASNVMVVCPKCSETVRVGYKRLDDGKKVRTCKKCGEVIDE